MKNETLNLEEILNLAYENGLNVGNDFRVLSYSEYLEQMGMEDNDDSFESYKISLENCPDISYNEELGEYE